MIANSYSHAPFAIQGLSFLQASFTEHGPLLSGPCGGMTHQFQKPRKQDKTTTKETPVALPMSFRPGPYSVICGRGRKAIDSIGNRRLQVIAQLFIPRYTQATRKQEKTDIVTEIIETVQMACDHVEHAFVRYSDGQWWQAGTLQSREKVGTMLRDLLANKYRSSTKSKLQVRRQRRMARKLLAESAYTETKSIGKTSLSAATSSTDSSEGLEMLLSSHATSAASRPEVLQDEEDPATSLSSANFVNSTSIQALDDDFWEVYDLKSDESDCEYELFPSLAN